MHHHWGSSLDSQQNGAEDTKILDPLFPHRHTVPHDMEPMWWLGWTPPTKTHVLEPLGLSL